MILLAANRYQGVLTGSLSHTFLNFDLITEIVIFAVVQNQDSNFIATKLKKVCQREPVIQLLDTAYRVPGAMSSCQYLQRRYDWKVSNKLFEI